MKYFPSALALMVTGAVFIQIDPLRTDRLATDAEMVFRPDGIVLDSALMASTHPIRSLVADDFSDLAFLRPLVDGARIVQLGESGHGMGDAFLLKARLARFLHQEMGFDVLAFESSIYQCYDADLDAATASARSTLMGCAFGVWHTEEVLDLVEYLRERRAGPAPLRLAGFDMQPIGNNKDHRPAFLARLVSTVDSTYAAEVRALDEEFLAEYAKGGSARRAYFRTHRDRMAGGYDRLEAFLAEHLSSLTEAHGAVAPRIGVRVAVSMAAYVRRPSAPDRATYAEIRDSVMAGNVRALLEDVYPGSRIIVWAHNAHVRHANHEIPARDDTAAGVPARGTGTWLRSWYGEALYTVGLYAYKGAAVNNARAEYVVEPPSLGSLEARLAAAGRLISFLDLSGASRGGPAGTREPLLARYNGLFTQELVATDQYHALVLLARVGPPTFFY